MTADEGSWPVAKQLQYSDSHSRGAVAMSVVVSGEVELYAEEREPADCEEQHDQYQHTYDPLLLLNHNTDDNTLDNIWLIDYQLTTDMTMIFCCLWIV